MLLLTSCSIVLPGGLPGSNLLGSDSTLTAFGRTRLIKFQTQEQSAPRKLIVGATNGMGKAKRKAAPRSKANNREKNKRKSRQSRSNCYAPWIYKTNKYQFRSAQSRMWCSNEYLVSEFLAPHKFDKTYLSLGKRSTRTRTHKQAWAQPMPRPLQRQVEWRNEPFVNLYDRIVS